MSSLFEEIDYRRTSLGELVLRRRRYLGLNAEVFHNPLQGTEVTQTVYIGVKEAE